MRRQHIYPCGEEGTLLALGGEEGSPIYQFREEGTLPTPAVGGSPIYHYGEKETLPTPGGGGSPIYRCGEQTLLPAPGGRQQPINPVEEEAALSTIVGRRKLKSNFKVIRKTQKEPHVHPGTFTEAFLTMYDRLIGRWRHYYGHPIFSPVVL
jgi:hypothetical protein